MKSRVDIDKHRSTHATAVTGLAALTSALMLTGLLSMPPPAYAVTTVSSVALGATGSYSVLGATGVASTLLTHLSGDLGLSPSGSITGFSAITGKYDGEMHDKDAAAAQAQADLLIAYNDADGRTPTAEMAADNNGRTFTAGVYHYGAAFGLTGSMTLDGQGDANAVFIFQVDAALNTAAVSHINLSGGAQASHVFWQVLGAAGTGAASSFAGTILAQGAITLGAGGSLNGRALSRGTVTLANNLVTTPGVAGVLSITVPTGAADLGSRPNTMGGGTVSGPLGQVQVSDARGAAAGSGWVASVSSTSLSGPGGAIPASAVSYTAGAITKTGTATYAANNPANLSISSPAVTATAITGNNNASWTPTITVAVPGSTVPGTYAGTITHSVL